jgi:hypothetical protein
MHLYYSRLRAASEDAWNAISERPNLTALGINKDVRFGVVWDYAVRCSRSPCAHSSIRPWRARDNPRISMPITPTPLYKYTAYTRGHQPCKNQELRSIGTRTAVTFGARITKSIHIFKTFRQVCNRRVHTFPTARPSHLTSASALWTSCRLVWTPTPVDIPTTLPIDENDHALHWASVVEFRSPFYIPEVHLRLRTRNCEGQSMKSSIRRTISFPPSSYIPLSLG